MFPLHTLLDTCTGIFFSPYFNMLIQTVHRLFNECDGIILNTSQFVESHAISAWKEWLSPRPVFSLGPLAPPVESIELHNEDESSALRDVTEFLETALDRYGENSVVYVGAVLHVIFCED